MLIEPPKKKRYRLSIYNDRADHDRLAQHLSKLGGEIHVALEATGNYHRTIAWRMIDGGFNTHLISSVALARTREALHNSWGKNDPRDAQVMLYMLAQGNVQRYDDPLAHRRRCPCRSAQPRCQCAAWSLCKCDNSPSIET